LTEHRQTFPHMCAILGAQLKECHIEKLVPYFMHPADESKCIRIFYDACHMIKLVRNTFAQEDITDENEYDQLDVYCAICMNSNNCMLPIKLGKDMKFFK